MNTEMKLHLAKYVKYMDEQRNVLVVVGNLEETLISQRIYEQHHAIPPEDDSSASDVQHRLMNACALAATSLSDRESWGWTMTLPGATEGFFVGMEPEGMICLRKKPADAQMKKVYLQRQKGDGPMVQSHFEPETDCPVKTVEQYFNQVVQTDTRIAVQDNIGVMVQALPDADFSAIREMDNDALIGLYTQKAKKGELKQMVEFLVFYECRCDEEMIYTMVDNLPKAQKAELFIEQTTIEIECPRCGRKYTASRKNMMN